MDSTSNNLAKIAVDKSLLKEYSADKSSRTVYMDNGTEFQIQLFNPYTYTIAAGISINGKKENHILIIKPGQRIWLDRFIDTRDRLKFSTYEVESDSEEVQKAIRNNGKIEISFHREKDTDPVQVLISDWINTQPYYRHTEPLDINKYKHYTYGSPVLYANSNNTSTSMSGISNNISITDPGLTLSSSYTDTVASTKINVNYETSLRTANNKSYKKKLDNKLMETGMVEKGSRSSQKLKDVSFNIDYIPFKVETVYILPSSVKPITSDDLCKKYCPECGKKLSPKFKFCPNCGNKI